MLCFGPYTVTLHFDGQAQLQIEGEFSHITGKNQSHYRFPIAKSSLMGLLRKTVSTVKLKKNGGLSLKFSNGDVLMIEGNMGPYEAYNLQYEGKCFVV